MADIERVIMPGVTHWHSPKFHAYFPTANSYPAIVADMLSGAIACIGFTWVRIECTAKQLSCCLILFACFNVFSIIDLLPNLCIILLYF